jgi:hypothetical protein
MKSNLTVILKQPCGLCGAAVDTYECERAFVRAMPWLEIQCDDPLACAKRQENIQNAQLERLFKSVARPGLSPLRLPDRGS